jgi:hypothetical protein
MNHTKLDHFIMFVALYPEPEARRGRKLSPFTTATDGSTRYPRSRAAYAYRLHHFKILTALDQGLSTKDPIAATKHCAGSVRRTLWLYSYECLPDFPAKQKQLDDLLATHNANLLMQGLEKIILEQLSEGLISDAEYAATISNEKRLLDFAERWFSREKGNRAMVL